MSLSMGYSYCINLTNDEKQVIDKQVRKNRFFLYYLWLVWLELFIMPMPNYKFMPNWRLLFGPVILPPVNYKSIEPLDFFPVVLINDKSVDFEFTNIKILPQIQTDFDN